MVNLVGITVFMIFVLVFFFLYHLSPWAQMMQYVSGGDGVLSLTPQEFQTVLFDEKHVK